MCVCLRVQEGHKRREGESERASERKGEQGRERSDDGEKERARALKGVGGGHCSSMSAAPANKHKHTNTKHDCLMRAASGNFMTSTATAVFLVCVYVCIHKTYVCVSVIVRIHIYISLLPDERSTWIVRNEQRQRSLVLKFVLQYLSVSE